MGKQKKTHDEYVLEVSIKNPDLIVIENYIDALTKINHKCKICGYIWNVMPSSIVNSGYKCPVCNGRIIGQAPEYKNSIWASKCRKYFSDYFTEEQMKTTMPYSDKKISLICPDCGRQIKMSPANLISHGIQCVCHDGISFANKFIFNVLQQLQLNVIPEYSPSWANNKRYDDYLVDYNIIIENHGIQHYEQCTGKMGETTLKQRQINDEYKKQMAIDNGIANYIVIDCRSSTLEWIKQNIMESMLPQILNFTEDNIDWFQALKYASSSLIKDVVILYNQGMQLIDIAQSLFICTSTVRKLLIDATQIGLCDYHPVKKSKRSVLCVELDTAFNSISEASRFLKLNNRSSISDACRDNTKTSGGYHWQYI